MANDLQLHAVAKQFGAVHAVRDVSLEIPEGEFFSLLGPSGCGKTTILRMVSGFIEPSAGAIRLGGQDLRGVAPNRRPTALIFQNLALFPLMTVADNVAYGLRVRGVSERERRRRAEAMLDLVALSGFGNRRVDEISGGQRQRVAIARALAVEPKVLLLDEPLSALDLKLRQHMRAELRALQQRTKITFIYITHDQGEAFAMSDRIAVMNAGQVEQIGTPAAIYDDPQTAFVASFVGEANVLKGRISATPGELSQIDTPCGKLLARNPRALASGSDAYVFVRPERVRLAERAENRIEARIGDIVFEGALVNVALRGTDGIALRVTLVNDGAMNRLERGATVALGFDAAHTIALPRGPMARVEGES